MEEEADPRVWEPKFTINLHACCKQPLRGCHRSTAESEAAETPSGTSASSASLGLVWQRTSLAAARAAKDPRLGSSSLSWSWVLLDAAAGSTTAWASPLVQPDEMAQTVAAALQPLCTGTMVFGRASHILEGFLFKSQPKELQQMIPVLHTCGIQ